MNDNDTPEPTSNEYEIIVLATTEEEAIVAFNESFDDDENYTEATDIQRYADDLFSVFFWSEEPMNTSDEPLILALKEVEAAR